MHRSEFKQTPIKVDLTVIIPCRVSKDPAQDHVPPSGSRLASHSISTNSHPSRNPSSKTPQAEEISYSNHPSGSRFLPGESPRLHESLKIVPYSPSSLQTSSNHSRRFPVINPPSTNGRKGPTPKIFRILAPDRLQDEISNPSS